MLTAVRTCFSRMVLSADAAMVTVAGSAVSNRSNDMIAFDMTDFYFEKNLMLRSQASLL